MQSRQARKGTKRNLNRTAKCLQRQIAASLFANPRDAFESNVRKYATKSKNCCKSKQSETNAEGAANAAGLIFFFLLQPNPVLLGFVWNPRGQTYLRWPRLRSFFASAQSSRVTCGLTTKSKESGLIGSLADRGFKGTGHMLPKKTNAQYQTSVLCHLVALASLPSFLGVCKWQTSHFSCSHHSP